MKPCAVIAIHGGAGALSRSATEVEREPEYRQALYDILRQGQSLLAHGTSALDVVTETVRLLEECPLFNAGQGSVFTSAGTHELDAAIMDGQTLRAGAVAAVSHIRNPILAARAVLEHSPHVMFCQDGAQQFAESQGLERVAGEFFSTPMRYEQLQQAQARQDHSLAPIDPGRQFGTVGAVALDNFGHLAAATSTGGMTNKQPGRIGDSPIIGAGCYANDHTVAVSATGTGEALIRIVAAYDISALMAYQGLTLQQAADKVVMEKLTALGGEGGIIAVDRDGNVALPFNCEGMYRGFARLGRNVADQNIVVGIYHDE